MNFVSYSFRHRLEVIFAILGSLLFMVPILYICFKIWRGISIGDPGYLGVFLVIYLSFLLIWISGIIWMIWSVKSLWFFQYKYRVYDSILYIFDPILGKHWSIKLDNVKVVRSFYLLHGIPSKQAEMGHTLEINEKQKIRIAESLSLWPEIEKLCSNANFEKPIKPWWIYEFRK